MNDSALVDYFTGKARERSVWLTRILGRVLVSDIHLIVAVPFGHPLLGMPGFDLDLEHESFVQVGQRECAWHTGAGILAFWRKAAEDVDTPALRFTSWIYEDMVACRLFLTQDDTPVYVQVAYLNLLSDRWGGQKSQEYHCAGPNKQVNVYNAQGEMTAILMPCDLTPELPRGVAARMPVSA